MSDLFVWFVHIMYSYLVTEPELSQNYYVLLSGAIVIVLFKLP